MNNYLKFLLLGGAGYFLYREFSGSGSLLDNLLPSSAPATTPTPAATAPASTPAPPATPVYHLAPETLTQVQPANPSWGTTPRDQALARAAANPAWVSEAGVTLLNGHEWNWYRKNYDGKESPDAGLFPYPAGITALTPMSAAQYHGYLRAIGLESGGVGHYGLGNYFLQPNTFVHLEVD